jgi:PTH1 family peptidyl-tRNA hydrolase
LFSIGNPGPTYAWTRHNAGHLFLDYLIQKHNLTWSNCKRIGVWESQLNEGASIKILKSSSFMNLSGKPFVAALNYWKIPLEQTCVVFDDLDQSFGSVKFKLKGSSGGHNGVQNIVDQTKQTSFPRLKIGIGRPTYQGQISKWVLSNFTDQELAQLKEEIFPAAETRLWSWLSQGVSQRLKKGML